MRTLTLRQTLTFKAPPKEIYEYIMDEKKHSLITGTEVIMSREVKGSFTMFGGYCTGHTIELVDAEKIVQAWRFDEDGWPEEHFSICHFIFEPIDNGTRLSFVQSGIPEHVLKSLKDGWHEYYWKPIKAELEKKAELKGE